MTPDDFRKLIGAGLTTEQIALVMEMMERDAKSHADAEEARKSKGRDRVAKWRQERRNVTVTQQNVTELLTGEGARGEDKTSTQKIEPQESKKEQSAQARLEGVLDPEHAKAVIDHRQRLRKPLTAYAARLLADKLASFPDPNGAVDRMIERGWQTVYPDDGKPQARGSPAIPTQADVFSLIGRRLGSNGQEREDRGGIREAVPHLQAIAGR